MILTALMLAVSVCLGADQAGAALTGTVVEKSGAPLAGARVQVATAAPRAGAGLFCPSCYRDCARWTNTDKDGRFAFPGLDPTLKFKLLVVMPGKKSLQTKLIDPLRGPVELSMQSALTNVAQDRLLRLQIVDSSGKPIAGALVDIYGAKTNKQAWYGEVKGVDPTVSDSEGNAQLVLPSDFLTVDLDIAAHGTAGALLMGQKPGLPSYRIVIPAGTRVEARLVHKGQPVVGARIAVVQMNRFTGRHFIKAVGAVSDEQGKVVFERLPADEEYAIYSLTEGAPQVLVLKTKRFTAKGNGQSRNLGDLELIAPQRLAGRLELPAGQTLPANTKIAFGREPAWDLSSTLVKPDGRFAMEGLPPETYAIRLVAKGYEIDGSRLPYQILEGGSFGLHLSESIGDLRIPLKAAQKKEN
jgi:uncharacterized GH25 family protein